MTHHTHPSTDSEDDLGDEPDSAHALLGGHDLHKQDLGAVKGERRKSNWEVVKRILIETCPTLLFTVIGMVFAGELLQRISEWPAFSRIDELMILVPILINLKGNIEMNLSARLSTAANIGELDTSTVRRQLVFGNLWLLQVQAGVVSAVAAGLSFVLGAMWPSRKRKSLISTNGFMEFLMVLSSSMWAASISGAVLGSFMSSLVIVCRFLRLDPDNITAPVAACLGDLLTMSILALLSAQLITHIFSALPAFLAVTLFVLTTLSILRTRKNGYVKHLLMEGWSPLFGAMVISSCAGMVLDQFVTRYEGFGMMTVVIGGLPGSVGSIFVSRLSTALHASHNLSSKHSGDPPDERPLLVAGTLLAVSLPVAITFLVFVWAVGWMDLPAVFVFLFVLFFCITTAISLLTAYALTHFFWSRNLDPDTYCLPLQSSFVDLVGPALLVVCYELAQATGAAVTSRRHHHH